MKRIFLIFTVLITCFALAGPVLGDSSWPSSGGNTYLAQIPQNKVQPGVLMLLLDEPDPGPPPSAGSSPVLDTGQTKCYDNEKEIQCPWPGKPFYGQDAHYPGVARSYTKIDRYGDDLPDGEVHEDDEGRWITTRDNTSGCTWEIKTNDNWLTDYDWYDAQFFIAELNENQFVRITDWRLPTRQELVSLINRGTGTPNIDSEWFHITRSAGYWTGTDFVLDIDHEAWLVTFNRGTMTYGDKKDKRFVRAVSCGVLVPQPLQDNSNGTVTDPNTGLMWQKCNYGQEWNGSECEGDLALLNWEQALEAAENLSWAGHDDWRLPNINELLTLVDDQISHPAMDALFVTDDDNRSYWSSTTQNTWMDRAWRVEFGTGTSFDDSKSDNRFVRAVRTVQN